MKGSFGFPTGYKMVYIWCISGHWSIKYKKLNVKLFSIQLSTDFPDHKAVMRGCVDRLLLFGLDEDVKANLMPLDRRSVFSNSVGLMTNAIAKTDT